MFYLDEDGERQDTTLHAAMLDDPETDEEAALAAVLDAIADDGLSEADALALYGTDNTPSRLKAHRGA